MTNVVYEYKCDKCGYTAEVFPDGGGVSLVYGFGMYICNDCKELLQLINCSFSGKEYGEISKGQIRCSICEGDNIRVWDIEKKLCPKCDGTMRLSDGDVLMRLYD